VGFRPIDLCAQDGVVEVTATTGGSTVVQDLPVSGTTADPVVSYSPAVAHPGRVTLVRGTNFFPGRQLTLTWGGGLFSTPPVTVGPDGTFTVPVVVLGGVGAGVRTLSVSMPVGDDQPVTIQGPPLLVVPGSGQPPDFLTRD
jgi:hypothetical protein